MNRTDTISIPIIDGEIVDDTTREIPAPWMRPPVRTVYARPENRLARRARLLTRSPFARHLRIAATAIVDGTWFLVWTVAAGLGLAALFIGFTAMAESLLAATGR